MLFSIVCPMFFHEQLNNSYVEKVIEPSIPMNLVYHKVFSFSQVLLIQRITITSISHGYSLYNITVLEVEKMNTSFNMNHLKEIRERKKLTQVRLSIDMEVSQELISQYERGVSAPTVPNLIKLSNFFNCSTDYLLGLTNNPKKITSFNETAMENQSILEKYHSLTKENQEHLLSYLDFLCH